LILEIDFELKTSFAGASRDSLLFAQAFRLSRGTALSRAAASPARMPACPGGHGCPRGAASGRRVLLSVFCLDRKSGGLPLRVTLPIAGAGAGREFASFAPVPEAGRRKVAFLMLDAEE